MLNSTALKSPAFLLRIKSAAVEAVKRAHAPDARSHGIGQAIACNRKGRPAVLAAYHRRGGLEFFDLNDRDITADVLAALRSYHREARQGAATPRHASRSRSPLSKMGANRSPMAAWRWSQLARNYNFKLI